MYTVIFDWKRTLYNPDSKTLIEGTLRLLKYLKQTNINIILIGKGGEEMYQETKRLKIQKYFSKIIFQKGKKNKKIFFPFVSKKNPELTLVIGDRVRSELKIGNQLKTTTIWIKQGKFSKERPLNKNQKPKYIVFSVFELLEFLKKIFQENIIFEKF